MRDSKINKLLHGLLTSFQGRSINFIEGNCFIGIIKCACLPPSQFVQISIHATALHNVLEVKIGLAVTNQIDFFADQFSLILASLMVEGPAKIGKLLKTDSLRIN